MLELNKIYNEDCMEGFKLIKDNSVDLVVIDPPYKLTSGGDKNTEVRGNVGRKKNAYAKDGKLFRYNSIKSKDWFKELFRVLKDGTHCYVMCNDKYVREYLNNAEEVGFQEVNILVWNKGMHTPTQYYMKNIEFILMFRKGKAKYINDMGSFALIDIKGIRGNKVHASEKPVELFKHLIKNSSNPNDIILDCFIGAGCCALATIEVGEGRRFIGFEIDEDHYNTANKRIEEHINKLHNINKD